MNTDNILAAAQNESLSRNQQSMYTWTKYKEDLKTTQAILEMLPLKISHPVLVPLGPKAYMPGKIVHTNELLVSLGSGYFAKKTAKQTSEYCDRKICNSDEVLTKLEAELKLLTNQTSVPKINDAFGSDDRPEIVEHVTEEEDLEWRKLHRQKEKEYRQKLAELRNKENKKAIESEQDLWSRLDDLELEEELEDELNRLHDGEVSDGSEESQPVYDELEPIQPAAKEDVKTRRKSVNFAEESEVTESEPLFLYFKHSTIPPSDTNPKPISVTTPADVYPFYLSNIKSINPVSILKVKNNPNQKRELLAVNSAEEEESDDFNESVPVVSSGIKLPQVTERIGAEPYQTLATRPRRVSKFKASRIKNN